MDCKHARLLLTFTRDRAHLDAGDAQGLQSHLGQCRDCDTLFAAESRFDEVVGQAMRAVAIPPELKERLLTKLTPPRRPWTIRRLVPAAIAACLLVALGLSWHLFLARQPVRLEVDTEEMVVSAFTSPPRCDKVEEWFKERKVSMVFPPMFDDRRLESISVGVHQGKRVAKLFFIHTVEGRVSTAHVLCLDARDFTVDPVMEASYKPLVRKHENGFIYIIYSGSGTLQDLEKRSGPAI
jgi:hypothetical protein